MIVNIGSGNGLVPSGTKPLPEPMSIKFYVSWCHQKLEQLERLRSEDTPGRLMITHVIESYCIPSQKSTKSKLKI